MSTLSAPDPLLFPTWPSVGEKTARFTVQPWEWPGTEEQIEIVRKFSKAKRKETLAVTGPELVAKLGFEWNVYSTFKGENWFHPISNENPPYAMLALAVDYDLPIDYNHVESACLQRAKLGGHCPTYIETSLSKHIRCVWTFEAPVLIAGKKFADEFLKAVGRLVEAENFLPGLDRKTWDCAMRWTNGGYWHELDFAKPISSQVLTGIALRVSTSMSAKKIDLPLERLADLLEQKYPRFKQFNGGVLKMGAVGIRFWEDGADNPNGAQVIDKGFYCVTGGEPIKRWEDLLNKNTIETMRAANYGAAADGLYFDGKKYFIKTRIGFQDADRQDILLHIAAHGFDRSRKKDETMSPAEQVLHYVQTENRVDGAAPLLFRPEGVVYYQGRRTLNISRATPMQPADKTDVTPADFPWLHGFFDVFFAHAELRPKDHFFAWWRRFYRSALDQKPVNGQAIFICGPRGCGKNLISELIVPSSMGGSAPNPYRFLMGDTAFSDDILESPVLAINDEDAPPEHKKSIFEQKVKSLVANNEHTFHPKFMKSVRIPWDGRLIVTMNDGSKDVGMLVALNPNTRDKTQSFLAQNHDHPFYDKYRNREIVEQELPFMLRWLLDVYQPPEDIIIKDRFGVVSYHDPYLVKVNRQEQTSYNLLELLSAWMTSERWNSGEAEWRGTPTDLLRHMAGDDSLENLLRDWNPNKLSKALSDLARSQTPGIAIDPASQGRTYIIGRSGVLSVVRGVSAASESTPAQQSQLHYAAGEEPEDV